MTPMSYRAQSDGQTGNVTRFKAFNKSEVLSKEIY